MNLFYYTLFFSSVGVVRKEKAGLTLKTCMLFYSWSFQYYYQNYKVGFPTGAVSIPLCKALSLYLCQC